MSKARLVITAVVVEGRPVTQVAVDYGVARSWIYELVARYRTEGEAAFEPRSRRPNTQPTAIPPATVELIIQLRRELTRQGLDAGPHTIAWHLTGQHRLTVSPATIWRTLKKAGLIIPEPRKKPKAAYVRFAAEQPSQCGKPTSPTTGSPDPMAHPAPMPRSTVGRCAPIASLQADWRATCW